MDEINDLIEKKIRESFASQAFMTSIGASIISVRPGEVEIELHHSPKLTQQHGYLHGAIVAAIGDTACGYSALTQMPLDAEVVSVEYKVNFLAPALGNKFIAKGRVIKSGRTLSVCAGEVYSINQDDERLVASIQATMMAIATSK